MFRFQIIKFFIFFLSICQRSDAYNSARASKIPLRPNLVINGGTILMTEEISRYVVSVRKGNFFTYYGHSCGGSIISSTSVLTAAHCVVLKNNKIYKQIWIIAGTTLRENFPDSARIYKANKILVHPNYTYAGAIGDIAVLRIHFIEEDGVNIQRIPLTERETIPNENCLVAGWGSIDEDELIYPIELMFINQTICQEGTLFPGVERGVICAGNTQDEMKTIRHGDSGGPLICSGNLSALVSFDSPVMDTQFFTDVWYYRDWIIQNHVEKKKSKFFLVFVAIIFPFYYLFEFSKHLY